MGKGIANRRSILGVELPVAVCCMSAYVLFLSVRLMPKSNTYLDLLHPIDFSSMEAYRHGTKRVWAFRSFASALIQIVVRPNQ